MLKTTEVAGPGTVKVTTVDLVTATEVSSVALQDPLQTVVDIVSC